MHLLEREWLTTHDVTLAPGTGVLESRGDARLNPFIYSAPMDTVTGIETVQAMRAAGEHPVMCRFLLDNYRTALINHHQDSGVWFSVGNLKSLEGWLQLLEEVDEEIGGFPNTLKLSVAVDVAHGDSVVAFKVIKFLRDLSFVGNIMSGSICTKVGGFHSINEGCTHLRVGVGPGAACTTRLMTGCGLPNLSAVYRIVEGVKGYRVSDEPIRVIADGGIQQPGDAVKYLAAGASGVMLGRVLASTDESPGWEMDGPLIGTGSGVPFLDPQKPIRSIQDLLPTRIKRYRGQASAAFQQDAFGKADRCPEGQQGEPFHPTGPLLDVVEQYRGGVASAISYLGLSSMDELEPGNVEFVRITPNGDREGYANPN